jgi:hypothetical protein
MRLQFFSLDLPVNATTAVVGGDDGFTDAGMECRCVGAEATKAPPCGMDSIAATRSQQFPTVIDQPHKDCAPDVMDPST